MIKIIDTANNLTVDECSSWSEACDVVNHLNKGSKSLRYIIEGEA
ncbi:MAG: hypothetical protein QM489_00935 [Candidatus Izemoplasma sp.]